ncbi:MAG TPA: DUF6152 family protein [Gammaproteobacteria bacterium]|nr:DUF6152 family protein [Gammaproteobacteria bacterium]
MRVIQQAALAGAALFAAALAFRAHAHHSFASEFDSNLEGAVKGVVTRVWWQNPHVRYDVTMKMPDGSTQEWQLLPPGNLPSYRTENWTEQTIQVGYFVSATGNLGRDGAKKLYATCIDIGSGPEQGRKLGRCATPGATTQVTADPNVDYTVHAKTYPVNITGYWDNRYKFHVTVDDFEPKPMPLTAAAKTIYDGRKFGDDQVLRCLPAGLPRIFGSPYPVQVVDAGTHYLMVFMQDNTPRRVWMDGRNPPKEQPLTSMGFSKGHWEDRTLVIETTMLAPGWLDGSGYPMSGGNDTRIVEHWKVAADGLTMERTMTVYDKLYSAPLVRTRGSQRGDGTVGLIESEPCDATPFYHELMQKGELEKRLQ